MRRGEVRSTVLRLTDGSTTSCSEARRDCPGGLLNALVSGGGGTA
jgi:hypothetical protein